MSDELNMTKEEAASFLNEAEDMQAKIFEKCLIKSTKANVGVFIKEMVIKDGELIAMRDVKDKIIPNESVKPLIRFSPEYAFLDLKFEYENDPALLSVNYLLESWLDRQTEGYQLKGGNTKIQNLVISLNTFDKDENGKDITYKLEFVNPAFFFKDKTSERLSFPFANLNFGIDNTDLSEVIEQIEYDAMLERMANEDNY